MEKFSFEQALNVACEQAKALFRERIHESPDTWESTFAEMRQLYESSEDKIQYEQTALLDACGSVGALASVVYVKRNKEE